MAIRGAAHRRAHVAGRVAFVLSSQADSGLSPGDASPHCSNLFYIVNAVCRLGVLERVSDRHQAEVMAGRERVTLGLIYRSR